MPFANYLDLNIAYDKDNSTELDARYFVYNFPGEVLYKGTYSQCLCVVGALGLDPTMTLEEINEKVNGFLFD